MSDLNEPFLFMRLHHGVSCEVMLDDRLRYMPFDFKRKERTNEGCLISPWPLIEETLSKVTNLSNRPGF